MYSGTSVSLPKTSCKKDKRRYAIYLLALSLILLFIVSSSAEAEYNTSAGEEEQVLRKSSFFGINKPGNWYALVASYERGLIDVLSHTIQLGSNGSVFDYIEEGGQNVLFPFSRLTGELTLWDRHSFIFLIQPLDVRTEALLTRDIVVDDLTFPSNTHLELRYGFTFYRISYLYDLSKSGKRELGVGLSLQLRNASISFASADGSLFRINENVGPVPIFKFRLQQPIKDGMWIGTEIDGFYASGKYITGSTNDFEGAILDASLRVGFTLSDNLDTFLNLRYIGGGAKGTEENTVRFGDGFTSNWLKTLSVSLGFYLH